jgi:hypothetical protein
MLAISALPQRLSLTPVESGVLNESALGRPAQLSFTSRADSCQDSLRHLLRSCDARRRFVSLRWRQALHSLRLLRAALPAAVVIIVPVCVGPFLVKTRTKEHRGRTQLKPL